MSNTPKGRFPKSTHLLKHADFQRVYQQGRRHFSGNMTVFYLAAPGDPPAGGIRVGFTVPKAIGPSVERNRIRRRMREAVRHNLVVFGELRAPVDVVINPRKTVLHAEFAAISREVEKAFQVILRNTGGIKAASAAAGEARAQ